ncbi:hypothetical protein K4B79_10165 [Streptomyces lincolnensis]|uniref:hypothetical protein n=1 Tax=Streptomyces lincolnensis TaxID=1915 RepID=UPI001E4C7759|nr:hypothetical protein [Streptomyces lincolnensis]MCD7438595.1 hypothetical protein [Streptomyces lincolnensis]
MDYMISPGLWGQIDEVLAGGTRASRRAALSDVVSVLAFVPQSLLRILEMTGAD